MYLAFDKFKNYLLNLDSRQIDNNNSIRSKHEDLQFIRDIVDHIKLRPAGEKEKPLLQYGTFFDGERLFYDEEIVEVNQEEFNHVVLNHVFHFISGAQFGMGNRATETTQKWFKSLNALYFSHFHISGVKTRYGGAIGQFYQRFHVKEKGYGLIFGPHLKTGNYFYEEFEKGNITLPKGFKIEKTNYFDCPEGTIYYAKYALPQMSKKEGLRFIDRPFYEDRQIVLFKDENGNYEKTDFMNKKAKELKGYKEIMEILGGTIGEDLDDE